MPMTIVGPTPALSQKLLGMINSGKGYSTSEQFRIEFVGVAD